MNKKPHTHSHTREHHINASQQPIECIVVDRKLFVIDVKFTLQFKYVPKNECFCANLAIILVCVSVCTCVWLVNLWPLPQQCMHLAFCIVCYMFDNSYISSACQTHRIFPKFISSYKVECNICARTIAKSTSIYLQNQPNKSHAIIDIHTHTREINRYYAANHNINAWPYAIASFRSKSCIRTLKLCIHVADLWTKTQTRFCPFQMNHPIRNKQQKYNQNS